MCTLAGKGMLPGDAASSAVAAAAVVATEGGSGERSEDSFLLDHAVLTKEVMTSFHRDELSSGGGKGKASWCLPRIHLGNLDMLWYYNASHDICFDKIFNFFSNFFSPLLLPIHRSELDTKGGAHPLLTEREKEALECAIQQQGLLVVKGRFVGRSRSRSLCVRYTATFLLFLFSSSLLLFSHFFLFLFSPSLHLPQCVT